MNPEAPIDLSVVVPVYKEEANIRPFLARMEPVLRAISPRYEILFCLDPSPDRTEEVIRDEIRRDDRIRLAVFSRRFGQPAATMAGISLCRGAACVVIDVDLQDPPELVAELHRKMQEGFDVVYAKRRSREGETLAKRLVSWAGYKVIARLGEVQIPRDTGDFRIMSRRMVDALKALPEGHGFLRGLVAYVGFPQAFVEYDREARHAGRGHYNQFVGSLKIGLNGIVSFGGRPLQLMSLAGFLFAGLSFLLGAWYVLQKLLGVDLTPGLSTTVLVVTFFSGVQLLSLGLMGEYVSRIYDEVKRRPMFIVDRLVNFGDARPRPAPAPGAALSAGPALAVAPAPAADPVPVPAPADPPASPAPALAVAREDAPASAAATLAGSVSRWDALLVLIVVWTAHHALFRRLGLYEDDYCFVASSITWSWSQAWEWVVHCITALPQGRPFGFLIESVVPFLAFKLAGGISALPVLYLLASGILALNALLVHRLLSVTYGRTFALVGALVFALYPADTSRGLLMHGFAVQPAHTFVLLALLAYVRGRPVRAYLLAAGALLTYESAVLPFFAAPLLAARWDRSLVRRWAGHLAILLGVVAAVVLLRYLAGEERVANFKGSDIQGDWSEIPSRILQAIVVGPQASLAAFPRRIRDALAALAPLHLWLRFAVALPLLWIAFFRKAGAVERRPVLTRALVTGAVMFVGGYGFEFSRYHFPPVELDGRLSAVHFGGTIGGSILVAAVLALLWTYAHGPRARVVASGVVALLVASLWMFGFVVQKGYVASQQHQRAYWARLLELMPDLSERSLVILVGAEPPASPFILTSSWADCYVLPLLRRTADGAAPRLVGGYNPFHAGYLEAREGELWWTPQAPSWLPIDRTRPVQREDVIVLERGEGGWSRRVGSITFHGVEIPLPPPAAGPKTTLWPGPLHALLLGP